MKRRRRKKRSNKKVITRSMKMGLVVFFCCIVLVFGALLVKIFYLTEKKGNEYKTQVLSQQTYVTKTLNYRRGEIKDRNDTTLALSSRVFNVIIEPKTILQKREDYYAPTVKALSECFALEESVVAELITKKPNSLYETPEEAKGMTTDKVDAFKALQKKDKNIQGVQFEEAFIRKYPLSTVGSDIIGFSSKDNQGSYGIEEKCNDTLNGTAGREYGYFDADLKLQRTVKNAVNGNNIILTVDANVQSRIEKQINKFQKKVGAENVAVMLMNPKNGEIYAMASDTAYDLNNPRDLSALYDAGKQATMTEQQKKESLMKMWSNYCISEAYEPGSTFKPFTVAAALEEQVANDSSHYMCDGREKVADRVIKCSNVNGHGDLSLKQVLMESCNDAIMQISKSLGRNRFYKYVRLFGFGEKTGVELPGETSGLLHTKKQLNPVELATSGFGQTQTVNMVQMLSGFCSLINGGNYYEPHMIKEIQNENGAVVESTSPLLVKKTISEKTSSLIRTYLKATVEKGTANPAKVKGYSIGGKTGTAEKRPRSAKNYLLSFIGAVPMEDPQVAIYVIINQPHVEDQPHSTYATEFAHDILKEVLPFLDVYPK